MDIDLLFSKVFSSNTINFDPNKYNYTYLLKCRGNNAIFDKLTSRSKSYMGQYALCSIDLNNDDINRYIQAFINSRYRNHLIVFCMDFANNERYEDVFPIDYYRETRKIRESYARDDQIVTIAVLPKEKDRMQAALNFLENNLSNGDVLYLFIENEYIPNQIHNNMCATIQIHSSRANCNAFKMLQTATSVQEQRTAQNIPYVKEEVQRRKEITVSMLGSAFYSPKMDYLNKFINILCKKSKNFTQEECIRLCDTLYNYNIENTYDVTFMNQLAKAAVNGIPHIKKEQDKSNFNSLKSYFFDAFGVKGTNIVELSMKVTLTMHLKGFSEQQMRDIAMKLFASSKKFHCEDLYGVIMDSCLSHIDTIKKSIENMKFEIEKFMSIADSAFEYDTVLSRYVGKYIELFKLQRRRDFWKNIVMLIKEEKHLFDEMCNNAKLLCQQLMDLQNQTNLTTESIVSIEESRVPQYAAADIINLHNDQSICSKILELYKEPLSVEYDSNRIDVNMNMGLIKFLPTIAVDKTHDLMITPGQTHSILVKQKMMRHMLLI